MSINFRSAVAYVRSHRVLAVLSAIMLVLLLIISGKAFLRGTGLWDTAKAPAIAADHNPTGYLATATAEPEGPFFFAALEGEASTAEQGTEVTVFVKQINLPTDYRENPQISANETWWLGGEQGIWQVACRNVETVADGSGPGTGGLRISLQSVSPIKGTYWLLSKTPLPPQMWQQKEVSAKGVLLRVIVTTGGDEFMLDSVGIPPKEGEEEADGPAQVRIDISYRKKDDTSWSKRNSFMTNSEVRPFFDVDGDGVPEIINVEWYSETILRKFYPNTEIVAIDASGV